MHSFEISTLITALVSLWFGIFVLHRDSKSKLNQLWSYLCLAVSVWSLGLFLEITAGSEAEAILWNKLLYVGAIMVPTIYFHFTLTLLEIVNKKRVLIYIGYSLSLFFMMANLFTPYFIEGVPPAFGFKYWVKPNILYYPYFLFFSAYFILSFYYYIVYLKRSKGVKRQQIKYTLISGVFGVSGGITVFFPQLFNIYPFGNYFVILYIIIVAYAIVKYRLMDIKLVLRKYSVYLASIISILIPAFLLKYIGYALPWLSIFKTTWFDFFILLAAISIFPALKNRYYNVANKYFFSSLYDEREVITTLSEKLTSTIEIDKVFDYISNILTKYFHSTTVSVLLFNQDKKEYIVRHDVGHKKSSDTRFVEDRGFYSNIILGNQVIIVEELLKKYDNEYKTTFDNLKKYNIDVLVPLTLKDRVIGLLALGPKESKDIYNAEDLRVLGVIGASAAIAIQNALLYEETKIFGIKLRKEVDAATKEIREANKKLMQLDAAKSEFISIASHQLRTPLTAIKGYISMMIEGDFGRVGKKLNPVLNKVYYSNERMIQLVENLLNVSRIESGKLQFIFKPTQIEEMVESVIDELIGTAVEKGLKMKYDGPDKKLPLVNIDEQKIRQVVLNLIDNAIKYTDEGELTISLRKVKNEIIFCVKDNGIGITNVDLINLFKKFSRGKKTYLVNPGGAGLGLFVAQQMVEAHNGKIWAESEGAGQGSRFCFALPYMNKSKK